MDGSGDVALDDGLGGVKSCVSIKFGLSLLKTIGDKVGSLNSRMKTSGDDDAATDDVEGCGVMCADADVEASGVMYADAGVHTFDVAADDGVHACDVAADDGGVEACVVADDDDDADACGVGEFHVITAGADDIDSVGDAEVGSCCEAISDSTRLRSCINA